MDITVYKLLHVLGILLVFQGIGAAVVLAGREADAAWRKASIVGHGIGLLFILVAGFGMLARLQLFGALPGWAWVKLGIWLVIGALPFVLRRRPAAARLVWAAALAAGFLAAFMAIFKPL